MQNVQFEEENVQRTARQEQALEKSKGKIMTFLIQRGIFKNETQAVIGLLVFCVIAIGLSVFLFSHSAASANPAQPTKPAIPQALQQQLSTQGTL